MFGTSRNDQPTPNGRALYRHVVLSTCLCVAVGLFVLFGPVRTIITEQAKIGIKPFIRAATIPWLAAALVVCAVIGLAALSKVTLTPRRLDLIQITMALALAGFMGFFVYDSFTAGLNCPRAIIMPEKPAE